MPYPPSWIDRLTARITALPVPASIVYGVLGLVLYGLLTAAAWLDSRSAAGSFRLSNGAVAGSIGAYLWLVGRSNVVAADAFRGLGAMLTVGPDEARLLEYRLTTLRPGITAGVGLLAVAAGAGRLVVDPSALSALGIGREPVSLAISLSILAVFAFVTAAFILKLAVQAWLVYSITTRSVAIDLLEVTPLYAFSRFTARMSISLILIGTAIFLAEPQTYVNPIGVGSAAVGGAAAIALFVLPLSGVHGRLVTEKDRHPAVVATDIRMVSDALHRAVAAHDLGVMEALNHAIASLEIQQRMLQRVPTWPWQPDTLRWVVGALMFPILLFTIQLAIQRLAGP